MSWYRLLHKDSTIEKVKNLLVLGCLHVQLPKILWKLCIFVEHVTYKA